MTAKQYLAAIEKLGMSQLAAGRFLGVSPRTAANYAAKGPPEMAAKLLRLMMRLGLKPDEVS
jgi:pentatricopeptide repeat protein